MENYELDKTYESVVTGRKDPGIVGPKKTGEAELEMGQATMFDVRVDLEEMGRRLEMAREKTGLSVQGLSFETKIGESLLRRYLRGETEPGASRLAKLADKLGVSSDWLIQNTDDPNPVTRWDGKTERRASPPISGGAPTEELPVPQKRPGRRRSA